MKKLLVIIAVLYIILFIYVVTTVSVNKPHHYEIHKESKKNIISK